MSTLSKFIDPKFSFLNLDRGTYLSVLAEVISNPLAATLKIRGAAGSFKFRTKKQTVDFTNDPLLFDTFLKSIEALSNFMSESELSDYLELFEFSLEPRVSRDRPFKIHVTQNGCVCFQRGSDLFLPNMDQLSLVEGVGAEQLKELLSRGKEDLQQYIVSGIFLENGEVKFQRGLSDELIAKEDLPFFVLVNRALSASILNGFDGFDLSDSLFDIFVCGGDVVYHVPFVKSDENFAKSVSRVLPFIGVEPQTTEQGQITFSSQLQPTENIIFQKISGHISDKYPFATTYPTAKRVFLESILIPSLMEDSLLHLSCLNKFAPFSHRLNNGIQSDFLINEGETFVSNYVGGQNLPRVTLKADSQSSADLLDFLETCRVASKKMGEGVRMTVLVEALGSQNADYSVHNLFDNGVDKLLQKYGVSVKSSGLRMGALGFSDAAINAVAPKVSAAVLFFTDKKTVDKHSSFVSMARKVAQAHSNAVAYDGYLGIRIH